MAPLFSNRLHQDFGTWPLGYIPYGGADFGEVRAVAEAVGDGDDDAYYAAWNAAGDRLKAEADAVLAKGHAASARACICVQAHSTQRPFIRSTALRSIRASSPHSRGRWRRWMRGLRSARTPCNPLASRSARWALPAYLIPAQGRENEVRPLIIFNNGYDATITDEYFACAVAASQRGYHSLLFDGPGQGAMLYRHGVPLRPDWDVVIRAVVDFAVTQPLVDPGRIALSGWSLGGHLAPRGASGEPRIAALIADPGTWSIADGFREAIVRSFGVAPEAAKDLGTLDQAVIDHFDAFIRQDRRLNWKVVQRGFWVHGVDDLRAYLASAELFTMQGHAGDIRCPTLITMAEHDALSASAGDFFEALRCPKTLLRFTAGEGADGHCEMQNRSLLNRRVLDWLDEQFAEI